MPSLPPLSRAILFSLAAMIVVVTSSNILVQYPLNAWLTWGALTYPFAFLVTDLSNRFLGPKAARRVVFAGFALAVLLSMVLANVRIAVASGSAFLVAQLVNVYVFDRLRVGNWWRAPLVSSTVGSVLDTALFFSLAFAPWFVFLGQDYGWASEMVPALGIGPAMPLWVSLGIGDFLVKLTLISLSLFPYRVAVARASAAYAR